MSESQEQQPAVMRQSRARRAAAFAGLTVAGLVLLVVLFWPVADLMAAHDVHPVKGKERAEQLIKARDAARGRLLQIVVGLLGVGAFVFTARNFALARQQSELNRQTLQLTIRQADRQTEASNRAMEQSEAVQITDRFARAIEQLTSEAIDARLGAIYSLERVAWDSERDHPSVMEVLAAFAQRKSLTDRGTVAPQDLQAAVTVIGRRDTRHDKAIVTLARADFSAMDLTAARLSRADLTQVRLAGAHLTGAELTEANLRGADLGAATLNEARLGGADLTGAKLVAAELPAATLRAAVLERANLCRSDLRDADLAWVSAASCEFRTANLDGADLTGAKLGGADLTEGRLRHTSLRRAALRSAKLGGADLTGADLTGADLSFAVLSEAVLRDADLTGADLREANLSGADLTGATLSGVDLTRVSQAGLELTGAIVAAGTTLPNRWRREEGGRVGLRRPGR
ncbi:pentapeptide repeat-containing protein [Actinomadura scrupuli]|uniref:pentapeptide repeat-containing protein n=1 Tax=Actinomadura scrupuli TaxID=559629 RepID=UPI003D95DFD8